MDKEEGSIKKGMTRTNGVVAGSVWETRMKMDQVKGGIKVFNGGGETKDEEEEGEVGTRIYTRRLSRVQCEGTTPERRRRKSWKPPENDKGPIQLRKALSELSAVAGEEVAEMDVGEEEKKVFDDKEVDLPKEKVEIVEEDKKMDQIWEVPISLNFDKKPPDVVDCQVLNPIFTKPSPIEVEDDFYESMSETHNRMRSIVDLVMWKDMPRSAFVFGAGTFLLISSSYTTDLNFSLISAMSYLGLLYLAVIFIYKSFICRKAVELDHGNEGYLIGEEEAVWLIKMLLPYINEILIKLRALFSGDPATTMKLGVLLFVLARCGGQITIWNMARMAFFGVFTIPKFCSSYSSQLSRYGNFWVERCRDAWDSCTHKKAAAAIILTLTWNLSSMVARIWAVFMLVVAAKHYQQCLVTTEWGDESQEKVEVEQQQQQQEQQQQPRLTQEITERGHLHANVKQRQKLGLSKLQVGVKEKKKA